MMSAHAPLQSLACAAMVLAATTADAQWIKLPTPGLPRLADGKPNFDAPAPRTLCWRKAQGRITGIQ